VSAPDFSTYGTLVVGNNVITIPSVASGQSIVVMASTPNSLGTGNLSISGAGASWSTLAQPGAPLLVCFIGLTPTVGSTSINIYASSANAGVGSYIVTTWTLAQFSSSIPTYTWNNAQVNGVSFTTPVLAFTPGTTIIQGVTSYDPFAGGTPPTWAADTDNLIAYEIASAGDRPIWMSWITPSSGTTRFTSPYSDSASTGVAGIILFVSVVSTAIVMLI
jgi:hypothetical protein